jgi:2-amino-4-hydroxy-6-hydroxymethyldihydropteridine diphosphokinase
VEALRREAAFHLRRVSSIYLTEPEGFVSANWFYNLVVEVETARSPWEVLAVLQRLERCAGRKRTGVVSDRTLDLDLLLYGDLVLQSKTLALPHPRLHERRFVLAPLTEINPSGKHPVIEESFATLLARLPKRPEVKRLASLK